MIARQQVGIQADVGSESRVGVIGQAHELGSGNRGAELDQAGNIGTLNLGAENDDEVLFAAQLVSQGEQGITVRPRTYEIPRGIVSSRKKFHDAPLCPKGNFEEPGRLPSQLDEL